MIGAATLAGGVVGLVAGLAARLAMRLLAALNPSTEGLLVAAMFPVGSFSFQGTFVILFQAVIIGAVAGAVYGLCRPALPRSPTIAGLVFGAWLRRCLLVCSSSARTVTSNCSVRFWLLWAYSQESSFCSVSVSVSQPNGAHR